MAETAAAGAEGAGETTPKIPAGYIPETEVAGLKAKRDELLQKLAKATERLKLVPEDFDPERWTKAQEAAENGKSAEERLTKQLEAGKAREAKLESALHKATIVSEATRAIAAEKGNADLLLPHVLEVAQVAEEDGAFVARIRDKRNGVRYGNSGEPLTIAELVTTDLKTRFPQAFEGVNANGSGSHNTGEAGHRVGKSLTRTQFDALPPAEKKSFATGGNTITD